MHNVYSCNCCFQAIGLLVSVRCRIFNASGRFCWAFFLFFMETALLFPRICDTIRIRPSECVTFGKFVLKPLVVVCGKIRDPISLRKCGRGFSLIFCSHCCGRLVWPGTELGNTFFDLYYTYLMKICETLDAPSSDHLDMNYYIFVDNDFHNLFRPPTPSPPPNHNKYLGNI